MEFNKLIINAQLFLNKEIKEIIITVQADFLVDKETQLNQKLR